MSNSVEDIESLFTAKGGEFRLATTKIADKLNKLRAFVFDWDGAFQLGYRGADAGGASIRAKSER